MFYAYAYVKDYVLGDMSIVDGEVFTSTLLPPKDSINLCWVRFPDEESAEQFADSIADKGIFDYPN